MSKRHTDYSKDNEVSFARGATTLRASAWAPPAPFALPLYKSPTYVCMERNVVWRETRWGADVYRRIPLSNNVVTLGWLFGQVLSWSVHVIQLVEVATIICLINSFFLVLTCEVFGFTWSLDCLLYIWDYCFKVINFLFLFLGICIFYNIYFFSSIGLRTNVLNK